jgi:CRISPR-associated protein Csh2
LQISHGVNQYVEGVIYSEQIMSPFRNPGEKQADSTMTTLGTQSKLREGHYVHHFSINPHNLADLTQLSQGLPLQSSDIEKLKSALCKGATLYDSAAKAGTENELLLWVQLKEGSSLVLPSFVEKVKVGADRGIDLSGVAEVLNRTEVAGQVEKIEIHCDPSTQLSGVPQGAQRLAIHL